MLRRGHVRSRARPTVPAMSRYKKVPWENLRAFLDPGDIHTVRTLAKILECDTVSVRRWKKAGGITIMKADELAVRLGRHPAEIWGIDAWSNI